MAIRKIRYAKDYNELTNIGALKGDRQGQYSLRLGYQTKYRLIYRVEDNKVVITLIEISEHYV